MKACHLIEVPLHYCSVRVRRMSPFHWALLRTLQVFAPGIRPGLEELTKRLGLGEPFFLNEAWRELLDWHAVDDADFSQARPTMDGKEAQRQGWFPLGPAVDGTRLLHFSREGKRVPPDMRQEGRTATPLTTPPPWSNAITAEEIERFLRAQLGAQAIDPDERLQGLRLNWAEARTVTFAPPAGSGGRLGETDG